MKTRNVSFTVTICAFVLFVSGCFGGGDVSTTEPPLTVNTWDTLIWDDGSNAPNTLWEN